MGILLPGIGDVGQRNTTANVKLLLDIMANSLPQSLFQALLIIFHGSGRAGEYMLNCTAMVGWLSSC
jgi:hypothetical protein